MKKEFLHCNSQLVGKGFYHYCQASLLAVLMVFFLPLNETQAQITGTVSVTNVSCNGAADGSATAQGIGGWAPYTYAWSNGATGQTVNGLAVGDYSVTITDIDLAFIVLNFSVAGGGLDIFTTASYETCVGSADATATAVVQSGGVGPYSFLWSDGQTTAIASGLSAGTYGVTVTDVNGCTGTASQVVELSPEGIWLMTTSTPSVCGQNNGTAHVSVMTGVAPFTYLWSNGNMTADPTGLAPGRYFVSVTDANGCEGVDSVDVAGTNAPDPGTISTNDPTTFCTNDGNDDIVTVTANGSTGSSFRFVVTDSNGNILDITNSNVFNFEGVPAGTCRIYGVTDDGTITGLATGNNISNLGGCFALTSPIDVTREDCQQPCVADAGTITPNAASVCLTGGSVTISGTPNGDAVVPAGYQVIYVLTSGTGLVIQNTSNNPSFSVNASGKYTIHPLVYDPNTLDLSIVQPGVTTGFDVIALLIQGGGSICASLDPNGAMVMVNDSPNVSINPNNPQVCPGEPVNFAANASGGSGSYTYQWTATGGTFNNANAASPTYTMMMPGTYTVSVVVTDGNGCSASASTDVTINSNPNISITPNNPSVCVGGSLKLTANAAGSGLTYSWSASGGSFDDASAMMPNFSAMSAGSYTVSVTVSNGSGCSGTATTTVTVNENPEVEISPEDPDVCAGESVKFTANATGSGITYSWSASAGTFDDATAMMPTYTMMMPGTYAVSVTVTDGNGCTATASTSVTINAGPDVNITPDNPAVCAGETVKLTANATGNGITYSWTASAGTFDDATAMMPTYTMMMPGTYSVSVTVTDNNGCTASASTDVTINANPEVSITPDDAVICAGEDVKLTATSTGSGLSYSWTASGGSFDDDTAMMPTFSATAGGTYNISVTVTDGNGCTGTANTTVVVEAPDAGTLTIDEDPVCLKNGMAMVSATPDGNANVPAGYETIYVLTSGVDLVIEQVNATEAKFTVTETGKYTLHTLVYNPATLNLGIVQLGVTTAAEVLSLLVQGGGDICASLDVDGAMVNVFEGRIGDYVWIDLNEDGFQNGFEEGYEGAIVKLFNAGPDGIFCNGDDEEVGRDTTDENGAYLIECVLPGEYYMSFMVMDPLYEFTLQNQGGNDAVDSDANADGKTDPFTFPGGEDLTIDAGIKLICVNYTGGGMIGPAQQTICPGDVPFDINNIQLPSGGSGPIEYMWMIFYFDGSTQPPSNPVNWTPIFGADGPDLDGDLIGAIPAGILEVYVARCARAVDCPDEMFVESNTVTILLDYVNCPGANGMFAKVDAQTMNSSEVSVEWTATPEMDAYNYFVERSADGIEFEEIGMERGLGNTLVDNQYKFMDQRPHKGRNYYRIKQVGARGSVNYSEVVYSVVGFGQMETLFAYPNPVDQTLYLESVQRMEGTAQLQIINELGQVVHQQLINASDEVLELDFNNLASGNYFVRITQEGIDEVKVIKISKQ